jgi:hypothetical protein
MITSVTVDDQLKDVNQKSRASSSSEPESPESPWLSCSGAAGCTRSSSTARPIPAA